MSRFTDLPHTAPISSHRTTHSLTLILTRFGIGIQLAPPVNDRLYTCPHSSRCIHHTTAAAHRSIISLLFHTL